MSNSPAYGLSQLALDLPNTSSNIVAVSTSGITRLYIDPNGNVGIGTTVPLSVLDVGGQANFQNNVTIAGNIIVNNITSNNSISFSNLTVTGNVIAASFQPTSSTIATNGMFLPAVNSLGLATNGSERMRIDSSGNVGIGTTSPSAALDVSGIASFRSAVSVAGAAVVSSLTSNGAVSGTTGTFTGALYGGSFNSAGTATVAAVVSNSTVTGTALIPSGATVPTNGIYLPAANTVGITAGGLEGVRVTTTGVGIGGIQLNSFNVTVNGGALGTVANSQVRMLNIFATDSGNQSSLEFSDVRNASGGVDWTTAGMRIQQKIDATYMGWIGFNNGNTATTNNYGISFGAGGSTLGPNGVPEVMRIDSLGNMGLGTTTPVTNLTISSVSAAVGGDNTQYVQTIYTGSTTGAASPNSGYTAKNYYGTSQFFQWNNNGTRIGNRIITNSGSGILSLTYGNDTEGMRIDANGNVGIGMTPSSTGGRLQVAAAVNNASAQFAGNANGMSVLNQNGLTVYTNLSGGYTDTTLVAGSTSLTYMAFGIHNGTSYNERMRIDASGNFLVGTTTVLGKMTTVWNNSTQQGFALYASTTTFAGSPIIFYNSSSVVSGFIGQTASTVSYNTSSDYRLKENVLPLTSGLTTISALKPVKYDWKIDGSQGEGFIAHELQAVIPHAVTGEKDAVNEDGTIKPQGVDYSKIVVHLVAAIQELKAEFDAYKESHP